MIGNELEVSTQYEGRTVLHFTDKTASQLRYLQGKRGTRRISDPCSAGAELVMLE